ncbi:hypothetical protein SAMN05216272_10489 [Pseudomonas panipatensis]|uniref:Uncharacterized protein n=1 Tax=Pseudomonas panipatensis TaxID=428992 RepID=A0A1G8G9C9_9PSED|nr:hypothetical protein SAMN05216272_10489 [Pseudomonas panipatensis]SMP44772.1 hypothetical protein SAMN06295951_101895 [Pseudomonas panipatensis]
MASGAEERKAQGGIPFQSPSEVKVMSKGLGPHKEAKKKPLKNAHEKRMAKKQKKSGQSLLGKRTEES